jgi:hypothetical protein
MKNTLKITVTITNQSGIRSMQTLHFPGNWDQHQRWAFIRLKETVELCDVHVYESDMYCMETGMSHAELREASDILYSREDIEAADFDNQSGDR